MEINNPTTVVSLTTLLNPIETLLNPIETVLNPIETVLNPIEKKIYNSFDMIGKKSNENVNFGKVEIYFENKITSIKLQTVYFPSDYAKKWFKNNRQRLGLEENAMKSIHKYQRQTLFKINEPDSNFNNVINQNINKEELITNINIHIKEIIKKIKSRTKHEYIFTPNKF